jgi:hypothetical protein
MSANIRQRPTEVICKLGIKLRQGGDQLGMDFTRRYALAASTFLLAEDEVFSPESWRVWHISTHLLPLHGFIDHFQPLIQAVCLPLSSR